MTDYKKAKGVLSQGWPAPEDLVRAARGDFEPLYREAQDENLRLRSALEQAQAQGAELLRGFQDIHEHNFLYDQDADAFWFGEHAAVVAKRALEEHSDGGKLLEVVKAAESVDAETLRKWAWQIEQVAEFNGEPWEEDSMLTKYLRDIADTLVARRGEE